MGRPFEEWKKPAIEEKWGVIDRYVHEDQGCPLVVADDDISGTLTFVRALEDSGLYADTPVEAFGDAWLNYIMEERTILWWGGMGMSTEHTAYLNLRNGMKAPESGAIATNGHAVAEQIGAQIFIDAFGMVAPGCPELAVELARRSASVSHDGEAVHAACVVAAMVSAAFVEKDMDRLLDIGVGLIPEDSVIAQAHRDIRAWRREDDDWHKTFERIDDRYGYHRHGGACHVIPNHAAMVMAWCYAPDNFYQSQCIINTIGWDTDCNAGNVGSVMGIKLGLDRINEDYDFQSPFADRLIIPTAEGTRSAGDVLSEALHIARMGRRIMDMEPLHPPKNGAVHHFEMPGAQHGYMPDEDEFGTRGTTRLQNIEGCSDLGSRALCVTYEHLKQGRISRISTPVLPTGPGATYGQARQVQATPSLYPGMEVTVHGVADDHLTGEATACIFVRPYGEDAPLIYGEPQTLEPEQSVTLEMPIPDHGMPLQDLGIEIRGTGDATGKLYVDGVWFSGGPRFYIAGYPPMGSGNTPIGWLSDVDQVSLRRFTADTEDMLRIGKNDGRGVMVTGTTDWSDYTFETRINIHMATKAGVIVRYQGLQRYLALIKTRNTLQLVEQYYGETVLDEVEMVWAPDEFHTLHIDCTGETVTVSCDGRVVLTAGDTRLGCGGAGYLVEKGLVGFRDTRVG